MLDCAAHHLKGVISDVRDGVATPVNSDFHDVEKEEMRLRGFAQQTQKG